MKIIELKTENIHSLYGKNTINFEKSFPDSLFLISGDTGAGKSSILDSITLALYGKIGRYEGDKINENIMSKGTCSSFAQVSFSCSAGLFTARWGIKRASKNIDGKIQSAKRQLIDKDGNVLLEKGREIDKAIEEYTGLNYDRFVKALMLQQGNFKRFILSSDGEKGELLEKITGDTIYSDISKKSHEIVKVKESDKKNIDGKKEMISVLSEDEIAEKIQLKIDLIFELKKLEESLNLCKSLKDYYFFKDQLDNVRVLLSELPSVFSESKIVKFYNENENELRLFESLKVKVEKNEKELKESQNQHEQNKQTLKSEFNNFSLFFNRINLTFESLLSKSNKKESFIIDKTKELELKKIEHSEILKARSTYKDTIDWKEECNRHIILYKKIRENDSEYIKLNKDKEKKSIQLSKVKERYDSLEVLRIEKSEELQLKLNENCISRIQGEVKVGDVCPICGNKIEKISDPVTVHSIKKLKQQEQSILEKIKKIKNELDLVLSEISVVDSKLEFILKSNIELKGDVELEVDEVKTLASNIVQAEKAAKQLDEKDIPALSEAINSIEKEIDDCNNNIELNKSFLSLIDSEIKKIKKNKNFILFLSKVIDDKNVAEFSSLYDFVENKNDGDKYLTAIENENNTLLLIQKQLDEKVQTIHDLKELEANLDFSEIDPMFLENDFENTYNSCLQKIETYAEKHNFYLYKIKELNQNIIDLNIEKVEIDVDSIDVLTKSYSEKIKENNKKIFEIEFKIKTNEENKKILTNLDVEEKAINEDLFYLKKIKKLIGSADGKQFSKYVQAITLNNMVIIANKYLQAVEFRYILNRQKDKFLSLEVIDTHQNNTHRPVSSLSGGESFIISLILAISLSDIAGRKSKIESLFVDEGFGSLDEVELERVFDILNKIKSNNRSIGIISHLQSVKEKVLNRIEVKKIGNGRSEINIV